MASAGPTDVEDVSRGRPSAGPTDVEAVTGGTQTGRSARSARSGRGRPVAMALGATVAFIGLLLLLYAASIHANTGDSDGASVVLEGQAMAHGHLLLNGWGLSLDSFWLVDALFYAVAVLVHGLRPGLLYAVPALLAALVIAAGVLIAREGRRGAAAVAGVATVVTLLAFPTHAMAIFFLRGPLHIGTTLWALIAFACLRKGRFGWQWAVAVVFLAAGALGDLQILVYGIAPVFLAGLVAMLRTRTWRGGIAQVTAAVAGLVLAEAVRTIAKAIGTFGIGSANPTDLHLIFSNLRHAASLGAELTGVRNTLFGTGGVPTALQDVHIVGALAMTAAFVAALIMLFRDAIAGRQRDGAEGSTSQVPRLEASAGPTTARLWALDDMLVIAIFGPPIAYGALALDPADGEYARYLTAAVVFAAILAGRIVARAVATLTAGSTARQGARSRSLPTALGKAAAVVGVAVALCFAAGVGYNLAQPDPGQPAAQLASWLEAHHLSNGVGSYWSASITTVESDGKVAVRPVVAATPHSHIVRYTRESATDWYAGQRFQFFVYNLAIQWGNDNAGTATATWGRPAHTYDVGTFRVLVWRKPLVLSPDPPQ